MAEPLDVKCPYCDRGVWYPCAAFDTISKRWWGERKPHAARVRAAEAAERAEKEKTNGK